MTHVGVVKNEKNGTAAQNGDDGSNESTTPPPDGGWGWMVVFASFMIHIVADGITYSFGIFHSTFLNYFNEGDAKTAWIASLLVGITLGSGPVSSSFVNRWGCQAVTIAGAILAAVCVMLSAFAQNVNTLIITIGVGTGFGFGLIYLPAIVSVTVWFERYRSLATGIAVCGSGLGTFLFAPMVEFLIMKYDWRGATLIMGAIILNCVAFGLVFRPVPETQRSEARERMLPKSGTSPLKRSQSTEHDIRNNGKVDNGDVGRLTLSQPALNKPQEQHHPPRSRCGSGVMHRPDILYQGSVSSLARHRAPSPDRVRSMRNSIVEQEEKCGWLPCAAESKAALSEMLDVSLLVDPIFILFALSNFLTSIGFNIPYLYLVDLSKGLEVENSAYLISIIGGSNSIGRVILGYISDKPCVNRLYAYNWCLTISGISTLLAMQCTGFWGLAMYSTVFGFTTGAYVGLTSVVLVDLLGLERLTNAFGLLLLFQGIASLIGPPLGGWLKDELNSYKPCFYLAGGTIALSGLILFLIPIIERRQNRKKWANEIDLEEDI